MKTNIVALYGIVGVIISITLINPDKIITGIKSIHDWTMQVPALYLISCGGLVLLISWWFYLIAGGTF